MPLYGKLSLPFILADLTFDIKFQAEMEILFFLNNGDSAIVYHGKWKNNFSLRENFFSVGNIFKEFSKENYYHSNLLETSLILKYLPWSWGKLLLKLT
jgi:hypothetical protein